MMAEEPQPEAKATAGCLPEADQGHVRNLPPRSLVRATPAWGHGTTKGVWTKGRLGESLVL